MDQVYQKFGPFSPGSFDGLPGILFSPSHPWAKEAGAAARPPRHGGSFGPCLLFHLRAPGRATAAGSLLCDRGRGKRHETKPASHGWAPQVGNAFNGGTILLNSWSVGFVFFSALPDVVPQSLLVDVYELV